MKNKKIAGIAALLLLQGVYATSPKIWMNGKIIESDALPVIEDNRTLVPIRIISENLGLKVLWNGEDRTVKVEGEDKAIVLKVGDKKVKNLNNEKEMDIDVAPKIINDRTYVPIRFVGEAFDMKVDWDDKDKTVVIGEGYNIENKDDKKDIEASGIVEALEKGGVKFYDKKKEDFKHSEAVEVLRLYTLEDDKSSNETIGIYEFKTEEAAKKQYDTIIEKYTKTNSKEFAEGLYKLKGKFIIALTINDKAKVNDKAAEIIENM